MTAKILKKNAEYVHRSTYRSLTDDELNDPLEIAETRQQFNIAIKQKLGPGAKPDDISSVTLDTETPHYPPYTDEVGGGLPSALDRDDIDTDHFDQYLNSRVLLPTQGTHQTGKVVRRKRNRDGMEVGRANTNPILDTREYVVQFPDGAEAEYSANVIAENMYAQCDLEGTRHLLLKSIVDHTKTESAIDKADRFIVYKGRQSLKKTTKGWKLCVQWRDGTSTWETLSSVKESNPVELAEYAVSQGIDDEPAFVWWIPFTLKKRERIISSVNERFKLQRHKFGIEIPTSVKNAKSLDIKNGNTYW